jgi:hypothetical protein
MFWLEKYLVYELFLLLEGARVDRTKYLVRMFAGAEVVIMILVFFLQVYLFTTNAWDVSQDSEAILVFSLPALPVPRMMVQYKRRSSSCQDFLI